MNDGDNTVDPHGFPTLLWPRVESIPPLDIAPGFFCPVVKTICLSKKCAQNIFFDSKDSLAVLDSTGIFGDGNQDGK